MSAFEQRPCLVCNASHYILSEPEERDLWTLLRTTADLSPEERAQAYKVLEDLSAVKTCTNLNLTGQQVFLLENWDHRVQRLNDQVVGFQRMSDAIAQKNIGIAEKDAEIRRLEAANEQLWDWLEESQRRERALVEEARDLEKRRPAARQHSLHSRCPEMRRRDLKCTACFQSKKACNGKQPCGNCRRKGKWCAFRPCFDFRREGRCDKPGCTFVHDEEGISFE
jgi:hypothetical protein